MILIFQLWETQEISTRLGIRFGPNLSFFILLTVWTLALGQKQIPYQVPLSWEHGNLYFSTTLHLNRIVWLVSASESHVKIMCETLLCNSPDLSFSTYKLVLCWGSRATKWKQCWLLSCNENSCHGEVPSPWAIFVMEKQAVFISFCIVYYCSISLTYPN